MKKIALVLVLAVVCGLLFCVPVTADDEIRVILNGTRIYLDAQPVIVNDRVLVPVRAVCEALGADVYWDEAGECVFIIKNNKKFLLAVGSKSCALFDIADFDDLLNIPDNKKYKKIDLGAKPNIYSDRVMIPIRAICEELGATVGWNNGSVIITCPKEIIEDKNTDKQFFNKYNDFIEKELDKHTFVYKHRGRFEIETTDGELPLLTDIKYSGGKMNIIKVQNDGNHKTIDVEYTDDANIKERLNRKVKIQLKDQNGTVIFDKPDFVSIWASFSDPDYEISFGLIKPFEPSTPLYLYIDDKNMGICTSDENGIIKTKLEKPTTEEQIKEYSDLDEKLDDENTIKQFKSITFEETPCAQYYDDFIVGVPVASFGADFWREIAQKLQKNFGMLTGSYIYTALERGKVDAMFDIFDSEEYKNTDKYYSLHLKDGEYACTMIIKKENRELYEQIYNLIKNGEIEGLTLVE